MADFLVGSAGFVLIMTALALVRVLQGPSMADRMMAAQLAGTGGIAILLLAAVASDTPPIVDLTLMLALLAAFASVAFVRGAADIRREAPEAADRR
jgi:multicomponent Na+:H+ antiporter subunit F